MEIKACMDILMLKTLFSCLKPFRPNSNVIYRCVLVLMAELRNPNIATTPPTTL